MSARPEIVEVGRDGVQLTGIITMPHHRGSVQISRVSTTFDRLVSTKKSLRKTQVRFEDPVVIGEVDRGIQAQVHHCRPRNRRCDDFGPTLIRRKKYKALQL